LRATIHEGRGGDLHMKIVVALVLVVQGREKREKCADGKQDK